jgi:hypothetical protein
VVLFQVPTLLCDLDMSTLESLFLCITLINLSYSSISYKVVLACLNDMFMCSSSIHHLEARVCDEHALLIQLIGDLNMFFVFVHKLEAHVLHEHDLLILSYRHRKSRICLCA